MAGLQVHGRTAFSAAALSITAGVTNQGAVAATLVDFNETAGTAYTLAGSDLTPSKTNKKITANVPGFYRVALRLVITMGNTAESVKVDIYKNGAALTQIATQTLTSLTGRMILVYNIERILWLEANDYITAVTTLTGTGTNTVTEGDLLVHSV